MGLCFTQEWKMNDNSETENPTMDITTRKRKNSDNCEISENKRLKNQERKRKYRRSLSDEKKAAINQKRREKYAERKRNINQKRREKYAERKRNIFDINQKRQEKYVARYLRENETKTLKDEQKRNKTCDICFKVLTYPFRYLNI